MIFSNGLDEKVRNGTKTQTRRLVKENDEILTWSMKPWMATTVFRNNRILWETWQSGKTYAIQSKRGIKGNGRFRITKIRKEKLLNINKEDIKAEGFSTRDELIELWNRIHTKANRWNCNPEVWVLEIEYVGSL